MIDVKVKEVKTTHLSATEHAADVTKRVAVDVTQHCSITSSLSLSPSSEELKLASHKSQVTFVWRKTPSSHQKAWFDLMNGFWHGEDLLPSLKAQSGFSSCLTVSIFVCLLLSAATTSSRQAWKPGRSLQNSSFQPIFMFSEVIQLHASIHKCCKCID